jgi:uroporphyrinogen III methyltransferase / synthase
MRHPRVLIIRPAGQADLLATRLESIGMEPVVVPAVAVLPPASWDGVDVALARLGQYAWILFTSANGVRMFFDRGRTRGGVPGSPTLRWAAIGPGTAAALAEVGIRGSWLPSRYLGESVGDELPVSRGQRVLRVQGETASPAATTRLRARGISVDEVVAYRIVEAPPESEARLRDAWTQGIDAIVFTSASTVRGFAYLAERVGIADDVSSVTTFAIGPVTAEAMTALGWEVHGIALQHSLDGLVALIEERRASIAADNATS